MTNKLKLYLKENRLQQLTTLISTLPAFLILLSGKCNSLAFCLSMNAAFVVVLISWMYPDEMTAQLIAGLFITLGGLVTSALIFVLEDDTFILLMKIFVMVSNIVMLLYYCRRLNNDIRTSDRLLNTISVNSYLSEKIVTVHICVHMLSCNLILMTEEFWTCVIFFVTEMMLVTSASLRLFSGKTYLIMSSYIARIEERIGENFSKSIVPDIPLKDIYTRFNTIMENDKLFLDPDFDLNKACQVLTTNRTYLSRSIGRFARMNFKQYVNQWRVNYAVDLFKADPSLRVADLSQMSGFNIIPSFSIAFKTVMGIPPSDWCKKYRTELLKPKKDK